ncbi:GNAT family N-acetyltransferase [Marimonas arenosa]|uniref:Aminoacyltransferase n=1 Tax=Marimonas arenosa TaxID=1795305 RepID=A0AAE4B5U8_9RHOB|nr:GNAT family N-acetyltransferase [Marimonas arenosa]MDQ2089676.1 aminoacyltransferase [Marimonas arenosa]
MDVEIHEQLTSDLDVEWRNFLENSPHQHPRQHPAFAEEERALGRRPVFAVGRSGGRVTAAALISLEPHKLFPGYFSTAWWQSGPICNSASGMIEFLEVLKTHEALSRVGRLHVSPYWIGEKSTEMDREFDKAGWKTSGKERFSSTGIIDLEKEAEEAFADFSKSARREVRRAARQEVVYRPAATDSEALIFLRSLNALRTERHLKPITREGFMAAFRVVLRPADIGVLMTAWKADCFLAGVFVIRSRTTVHVSHFTTEPEPLAKAGNLRIAPALWFEAMKWGQEKGCAAMDVEGYELPAPGSKMRNIYKYKSELSPDLVYRVSAREKPVNKFTHLTGSGADKMIGQARRLSKRLWQR